MSAVRVYNNDAELPKTQIKRSESIATKIIVRLPNGVMHIVDTPKQAFALHTRWAKGQVASKGLGKLISMVEWEGFNPEEIPK